jgi:hypothetical protein
MRLQLDPQDMFTFFTRDITGKQISLSVFSSTSLFVVKQMLSEKTGIPMAHVHLMLASDRSELVKDDATMTECNITQGSLVLVVMRGCFGGIRETFPPPKFSVAEPALLSAKRRE